MDGGEQQLKTKSTLTNNILSEFVKTSEGNYTIFLLFTLMTKFEMCQYFCSITNRTLFDIGRLVLYLVREFLAFLKLDSTLSVFEAEAIEGRNFQVTFDKHQ